MPFFPRPAMNRLAIVFFAEYHCPLSEERRSFTEIALYGAIVLAVFRPKVERHKGVEPSS